MSISLTRSYGVFDSNGLGDVHVVGCGAVGSKIALELAKLGIKDLHLWDFDKVEEHNIGNQAFGINDIGEYKANALRDIINRDTGIMPKAHISKVTNEMLGEIVFIALDSMEPRKQIVESCTKHGNTKFIVDPRLGIDFMEIYTIDMTSEESIKKWNDDWFPSSDVQEEVVGSCRVTQSIGATSSILAGLSIWNIIKYNSENVKDNFPGRDNTIPYNTFFCIRPMDLSVK